MRGFMLKEWLYTRRDWRSIVVNLGAPGVVIVLNTVVLKTPRSMGSEMDRMTMFLAFYGAVSFATVFRGVSRVRAELQDGTGHLYLLATRDPAVVVLVKLGFEVAISLLAVAGLLGWIAITRPTFLDGGDVMFTVLATLSLTAFTFALSCRVRSDETFRIMTFFLSMSPLLPGFFVLGSRAADVSALIPTVAAFDGFRSIAANLAINNRTILVLALSCVVSIAVSFLSYPAMLRFAYTRSDR